MAALAGLSVLGVILEVALGRSAADAGVAALGLGLVAVGLTWVAGRGGPNPPGRS